MTTENATDPGAFESASSARSQAMAQIAKQVHDENAADFSAFNEDTGEIVKTEPVQAQPEPKPEPAADNYAPPDLLAQEPPADEGLETIVIDGQERKVKREQIIEAGRRTLQKESAADRRLEEAAETLRRVKAMEATLMQRQPSSDADGQQQASSDPANGNGAQGNSQATPNTRALVREELWLDRANEAAQRFKEEFKDLADDPFSARLVAQLENERLAQLAQEGKPVTDGNPWTAYQAHGTKVREWLGKAKPGEPVKVSEDKSERKRATVTVTGSTTSRPAPTQAKPPTTSERIEQMRVARMGKAIPIAR